MKKYIPKAVTVMSLFLIIFGIASFLINLFTDPALHVSHGGHTVVFKEILPGIFTTEGELRLVSLQALLIGVLSAYIGGWYAEYLQKEEKQ